MCLSDVFFTLVRDGGTIAFHVIAENNPDDQIGVNRFWNEIRKNFQYQEIIKDRNQRWAGIGALYFKEKTMSG